MMSKNSEAIKRQILENREFKKAYEQAQIGLDIADLVYNLRQKEGMNQSEFAKKVNLSRSTIARIESSRVEPTLSTIAGIAKALGKKVELEITDMVNA